MLGSGVHVSSCVAPPELVKEDVRVCSPLRVMQSSTVRFEDTSPALDDCDHFVKVPLTSVGAAKYAG